MAFLAFPTDPKPDADISIDYSPRFLEAQFGDGYSQRAPDGINFKPLIFELRFTYLTEAEKDTIINFLDGQDGHIPFTYQLPDEGTPRQWICRRWRKERVHFGIWNVTATFEENFDLV